ncbi:MAG: FMN-binding protein [Bacteroidales bacterium]|nr:FMN-binding protein [Bacteroidales bacterium]
MSRTAVWPRSTQTGYAELITSGPDTLGYLMLSSGMGRYNRFDYLALLSPDIRVVQIGITDYRSDHGYQIASPRWLAQFKGYSADSLWQVGREVDAISGATISATGLCNDLYQAMQRLKKQVSGE